MSTNAKILMRLIEAGNIACVMAFLPIVPLTLILLPEANEYRALRNAERS